MESKVLIISEDFIKVIESDTIFDIKNNAIINLTIKENKTVNILNFLKNEQNLDVTINITLKSNSRLNFNNIDTTNSLNNFNINILLQEQKAYANINNIVIKDNAKAKYKIKIINDFAFTKGYINQRAVVKNGGEVILNAVGDIKKQSTNSENLQESRVLLLDKAALGEASPLLLIDNNDIIAGHKASVSKVDEEQLYYLQTRGINKKDGEHLLTQAFIKPILDDSNLDLSEVEQIIKKGV